MKNPMEMNRIELIYALRRVMPPAHYLGIGDCSTAMLRGHLAYYSAPESERGEETDQEISATAHGFVITGKGTDVESIERFSMPIDIKNLFEVGLVPVDKR